MVLGFRNDNIYVLVLHRSCCNGRDFDHSRCRGLNDKCSTDNHQWSGDHGSGDSCEYHEVKCREVDCPDRGTTWAVIRTRHALNNTVVKALAERPFKKRDGVTSSSAVSDDRGVYRMLYGISRDGSARGVKTYQYNQIMTIRG